MATVRTINRLINSILIDILNVYHPGESIEAADSDTVLHAIQDRLDSWVDQVHIPIVVTEYFALVSGTASYTIGEDGVLTGKDTVRPDSIIGAYIRQGDYDYPVKIITEWKYRKITDKSTTGRPTHCYPYYDSPNITVYFWPIPDITDNFYFSSIKVLAEPSAYTDDTFNTLGIPPYIYNALKWRVAIDVAPGFYKQATQEMTFNANDAYNQMLAKNLSQSMRNAPIEMALIGKGRGSYSLADFFAGK